MQNNLVKIAWKEQGCIVNQNSRLNLKNETKMSSCGLGFVARDYRATTFVYLK